MPRTAYLSTIHTLAAKDWYLFWTDRRAAILCFVVPIVLASTFGMIFHRPVSDATGPTMSLPVLIAIEDDGPFTARIVEDLLTTPRLDAKVTTRERATAAVMDRRPGIAVVFPEGFERLKDWQPGQAEKPAVQIIYHPAAAAERQWAEGMVAEAIVRRLAREKLGSFLKSKDESALGPPFRVEASPVTTKIDARFNSYSHSFCGMTLQYLLFWGMESGLCFLRERNRGVWCRMRAAPISLGSVLIAKAISTAAIAMLQVLATFGFGYVVFGVNVSGSSIGFIFMALASCGLAAATGLLVAAIGGTEARARSVSILVILGVSLLGGLWMPAFLLPQWIRELSLSLPTAWAMRGFCGVTWQGTGFLSVLPCIFAVGAFALGFLMLASLLLKRSERRLRCGDV